MKNTMIAEFFSAIKRGEVSEVEKLLDQGINPNVRDHEGFTGLHQAVLRRQPAILKLLLETGAAVNSETPTDRATPLHYAAEQGEIAMLSLLIEQGAALESIDVDRNRPLHLATSGNHDECVRHLLAVGAQSSPANLFDVQPIHFAARNGNVEQLRCLLKAGASPDAMDENGSTPLHYVVAARQVDAVFVLLEAGASVDARTRLGENARSLARDIPGMEEALRVGLERRRLTREAILSAIAGGNTIDSETDAHPLDRGFSL